MLIFTFIWKYTVNALHQATQGSRQPWENFLGGGGGILGDDVTDETAEKLGRTT